ncbi:MerR family transcriptional regulator [Pediococcus pentosaceus]|uniref:MerR family transcriptional regulator n=1 Tax=Pediococcus pentosaceus TaxID=1255 RepID=UPI0039828376
MKIKEVTNQFSISSSTLRYYEHEGLLGPVRCVHGIRDYSDRDLERLDFILCTKKCRMSLKQIQYFINIYEQGDETIPERLAVLQEQLAKTQTTLVELTQSMDHLKDKIDNFHQLAANHSGK